MLSTIAVLHIIEPTYLSSYILPLAVSLQDPELIHGNTCPPNDINLLQEHQFQNSASKQ